MVKGEQNSKLQDLLEEIQSKLEDFNNKYNTKAFKTYIKNLKYKVYKLEVTTPLDQRFIEYQDNCSRFVTEANLFFDAIDQFSYDGQKDYITDMENIVKVLKETYLEISKSDTYTNIESLGKAIRDFENKVNMKVNFSKLKIDESELSENSKKILSTIVDSYLEGISER